MRIVLRAVQSCSGDVQHQSSHIHSPTIESIFIKDVCNCTVIITDKRRLKIKAISALRAGSFCVSTKLFAHCLLKNKTKKNSASKLRLRLGRCLLTMSSRAQTLEKKRNALSVYCQHKEGVREEYLHLMNIHQSNGEFGQITIKALQAAAEW